MTLHPEQFRLFSGARQGTRYLANDGAGLGMMKPHDPEVGQQSLFPHHELNYRYPQSVAYGEHVAQRGYDPTKWQGQMALPGMPKPTDPHLERLQQNNPRLAGLKFTVHNRTPHKYDDGLAHKVEVHDETGNRVGYMKLGHQREDFEEHPGHREVDELGVAPAHQRRGIAEAMYDLARMKGAKIVASSNRSESGDAFAHRVGAPKLKRRDGHNSDDYLGLDAPPHKV